MCTSLTEIPKDIHYSVAGLVGNNINILNLSSTCQVFFELFGAEYFEKQLNFRYPALADKAVCAYLFRGLPIMLQDRFAKVACICIDNPTLPPPLFYFDKAVSQTRLWGRSNLDDSSMLKAYKYFYMTRNDRVTHLNTYHFEYKDCVDRGFQELQCSDDAEIAGNYQDFCLDTCKQAALTLQSMSHLHEAIRLIEECVLKGCCDELNQSIICELLNFVTIPSLNTYSLLPLLCNREPITSVLGNENVWNKLIYFNSRVSFWSAFMDCTNTNYKEKFPEYLTGFYSSCCGIQKSLQKLFESKTYSVPAVQDMCQSVLTLTPEMFFMEFCLTSPKECLIRVQYDVGWGNQLYIRGEEVDFGGRPTGLNWSQGRKLKNISSDCWDWESRSFLRNFGFKLFINDEPSKGSNDYTYRIENGRMFSCSPCFTR